MFHNMPEVSSPDGATPKCPGRAQAGWLGVVLPPSDQWAGTGPSLVLNVTHVHLTTFCTRGHSAALGMTVPKESVPLIQA